MVDAKLAGRNPLLPFGIALILVSLAALVQWSLLGTRTPFILVLPTVMAVAWYGGLGPGLLATAVGILEVAYFFFDPPFSLRVESAREVFALAVFGFLGTSISMLIERLHQSERARRQAEARVLSETKKSLQDREEHLHAVLTTATDAIITIDSRGIIQTVNPAAVRMFGYAAGEMIGQNVKLLMPPPYREEHDRYLETYQQSGEKHMIGTGREVEGRRKDGSVFPVDLAVSEIEPLKFFTGILRDATRRHELEREVVEAASIEQRRIGQDLHDTVAQELTALNMLVKDLAESVRTDPETASQLIERIAHGLRRSHQELRAVLRGLFPVAVDSEGLVAALTDLVDRTQQERKVTCVFDCPEPVAVADNLTATHLYLITREGVQNAVKHANARTVRITLKENAGIFLSVQDDGMGLLTQSSEIHGLGLRIMRNRAEIIGAKLTIEPARPFGTVVTCELPRKDQ